jgi:hypothetical protein
MPGLCSTCPNLPHYWQHQRHRQITDCVVAPPRYHSSPRNRKVPGAFCFRLWQTQAVQKLRKLTLNLDQSMQAGHAREPD